MLAHQEHHRFKERALDQPALAGAVALLLYKRLKRWTKRPRPFAADGRIRAWVAPLDEFSFPSGHTLHAVSFTIVALAYGGLLEGAVLIETVFSWPGFGQYMTNNMLTGDMNAVMTCVLLVGVIFIALNLLSDLLYKVFDPRTR